MKWERTSSWTRPCALLGSMAAALALGCPMSSRHPGSPATGDGDEADQGQDAGSEENPSVSAAKCVDAEPDFRNFDFLPDDARFVAWTRDASREEELRPYELVLAQGEFLGPQEGVAALSGDTQLAVAGIGFERQVVALTLVRLGIEAHALLKVEAPSGKTMWVAPHACDLGQLRERAAAHWGMAMREAVGGWLGTPSADSRLPFDLVLMSGDLVVLAPRGHGASSLSWFARAEPGSADALGPWLEAEPSAQWCILVQDAFQSAGARSRSALRVEAGRRVLVELPTGSLPER